MVKFLAYTFCGRKCVQTLDRASVTAANTLELADFEGPDSLNFFGYSLYNQPICSKLGGEIDSAIRRRKITGVTSWRGAEQAGFNLKTFLKHLLKMASNCCEFACYNRKLSLNNSKSFFP